jgi:hypothetical protein
MFDEIPAMYLDEGILTVRFRCYNGRAYAIDRGATDR